MGNICRSTRSPKHVSQKCNFVPESVKNNSIIRLEFSIENIEINHNYYLQIILSSSQQRFNTGNVLSKTPFIKFNEYYNCEYYFEKNQILYLELYEDFNLKDLFNVPLGIIICSYEFIYKKEMKNGINMTISAIKISDNSYANFKIEALYTASLNFEKLENKISYSISSGEKEIYSSESISKNGKFKEVSIPLNLLEKGFNINFFDAYQECLFSKMENIFKFCENNQGNYFSFSSKNNKINIINNSTLNFDLIDYFKAGVRIKFSIGIDYTSSNYEPKNPRSLHYLGNDLNDYEQTIKALGSILSHYCYEQKFSVYGFGALLNNKNEVNHCFNINFENNEDIYTIDNILKEYRKSFKFLKLAGPTKFSPLIQKIVNYIKNKNEPLIYHILLILTDAIVSDIQSTIDILVEGSILPLSIIFIGIGNDNFPEIEQLYYGTLVHSSSDDKIKRENFIFFPYNNYRNESSLLAKHILEDIYGQICEYYTMNLLHPNKLNNKLEFKNYNNRSHEKIEKDDSIQKSRKMIAVIFYINEQNIHFSIPCFDDDIFSTIEKQLFDEFPELKNKKIYYIASGSIINKDKTLKENNIHNSTTILINYYE